MNIPNPQSTREYPGGGFPRFFRPTIAGLPTADPGAVASAAIRVRRGRFTFASGTPASVSRLPSAMAVWEVQGLHDLVSRGMSTVDIGNIIQASLFVDQAVAPTDEVFAVGFSAGAVSAANVGVACMLEAVAGVWRAQHAVNTGAGWAITNAAATAASTRGVLLQCPTGTATTQGRPSAVPYDSGRARVVTANSQTAPTTSAVAGGWDRFFVGAGWATGVGGVGRTVTLDVSALLMKLEQLADFGIA